MKARIGTVTATLLLLLACGVQLQGEEPDDSRIIERILQSKEEILKTLGATNPATPVTFLAVWDFDGTVLKGDWAAPIRVPSIPKWSTSVPLPFSPAATLIPPISNSPRGRDIGAIRAVARGKGEPGLGKAAISRLATVLQGGCDCSEPVRCPGWPAERSPPPATTCQIIPR